MINQILDETAVCRLNANPVVIISLSHQYNRTYYVYGGDFDVP